MSRCWFLRPTDAPSFIQLGRYGDLILLLPAFLEIFRRTGLKPNVVVSEEYASVLDGVSYVTPHPLGVHWWGGIPMAKDYAKRLWGHSVCPAWWNDVECPIPPEYRGQFTLQCHGHSHGVNIDLWPNFMVSMYSRAGFTQSEMMSLACLFDRRNPNREAELVAKFYPPSLRKKPLLLYNFTGISSPFGFLPELWPTIQRFAREFHIVDLGKVKAHRIFDLLGAYDVAAGLITCDTATAHLAHASQVPTIWMSVDGWCGSVPRGNVALHFGYNETPRRLNDVADVLQSWRNGNSPHLVPLPDARPGDSASPDGSVAQLGHAAVARLAH